MNIKTFDAGEKFPNEFLFNGKPYKGDAAFLNGYNGYESSPDDAMLCAVINFSCWDSTTKKNFLTDMSGNYIKSTNRRGTIITIK